MENLYSILERNKPYWISFDSRASDLLSATSWVEFEGAPNTSAT